MAGSDRQDYLDLVAFWDRAFSAPDGQQEEDGPLPENAWEELAPSPKLLNAARSLGNCENVLDYGSGSGWGGIIIAKSGCRRVTCADPAPNACKAAERYAEEFGVLSRVHPLCINETWLSSVSDGTYDGIFCSNVLDVVPPHMAEDILGNMARIAVPGGRIVIGLNFCMRPEAAAQRGLECKDGNMIYMDGVLRLVSRTDEEWALLFGRFFRVERLEHFAWPGEKTETRRLFFLVSGQGSGSRDKTAADRYS